MDGKNLKEYALEALVITLIVFIVGLMLGRFFQVNYAQEVSEKISDVEMDYQDMQLALLMEGLNNSVSCKYYAKKMNEVKKKIESMKPTIVKLEKDLKIDTKEYRELKKKFMAVRLKYWLLSESLKDKCNKKFVNILYFYKTEEECTACTKQGHVLSYMSDKYDFIEVVPIDKDEDLILIKSLKEAYNITKVPSLVIDRKIVEKGYTPKEEILNYACEKFPSKEACK